MAGEGEHSPPQALATRGIFRSPLTWRLIAINVLALAALTAGWIYLDQLRSGLVEQRINALITQGRLIAGALGEAALVSDNENPTLETITIATIVRRLANDGNVRIRLFAEDGHLIVDSRRLVAAGRKVEIARLPDPSRGWSERLREGFTRLLDALGNSMRRRHDLKPYVEHAVQRAEDYPEVLGALEGLTIPLLRKRNDGGFVLGAATPVQSFKKILGALLLTVDSREIDKAVRRERIIVLALFALTALVTILVSLLMAGTILRPIRRLAAAAERIRSNPGAQKLQLPLLRRHDEIGELAVILRDMTETLYQRMEAVEAFAADVSHELKNPLTSLRSAVETLERIEDKQQQARLLEIILDDVGRIDRLITDITTASRIDAEMARQSMVPCDLADLIGTAARTLRPEQGEGGVRIEISGTDEPVMVRGIRDRLGQVVHNLVDNAVSFSPPGGTVSIRLESGAGMARLIVEDEGPGLPEGKEEEIFSRFYSLRPEGEAFGRHSGLGLSIARQITDIHGGSLRAENILNDDGTIRGARFIVSLPLL